MASGFVRTNQMKRMESKKSHSWGWDSHISSKNSKWMQENLEEMDQLTKRMLKLIEDDADSFAKKAELYFKKRPELVTIVEEFYRMYRSLAERYDNVTGELRKNIPSDIQSQGSGISDIGSEPLSTMQSPDRRPSRTKSGPRAAGFDFFLGSAGSSSDVNSKGDDTSTLDSDVESDDSSVNNNFTIRSNGDDHGLHERIIELEAELQRVKEKLWMQEKEISKGNQKSNFENSNVNAKIAIYEEELRVARSKIQLSEVEIARLTVELQKYESFGDSSNLLSEHSLEHDIAVASTQVNGLEECFDLSSAEAFGSVQKVRTLEDELKIAMEKLHESENEVTNLRQELGHKTSSVKTLQEQLKLAQRDVAVWNNKFDREKKEVSKLQDRVTRYKVNLAERDQEIRGLREAMSNANKALSEENEQLKAEMTRMTKEQAYLEHNLKEMDLRCHSLEEEVRRLGAAIAEREAAFEDAVEQLKGEVLVREDHIEELSRMLVELKTEHQALMGVKDGKIGALEMEISTKDEQIGEMDKRLQELQLQHAELIAGAEMACKMGGELRTRVEELEMEVERMEETIVEGAEGKREAIRQLCFSLEHYRSGYHELRQAVISVHRRPAVVAT